MKLKTMIVVMLVFGFAIYQAQASERHPTAYTNVTSFEQSTLPPELEIVRFSSPEEEMFFAYCNYVTCAQNIAGNEQKIIALRGDRSCCTYLKRYLEGVYNSNLEKNNNNMKSLQKQYPFLLTVAPNKLDLNNPLASQLCFNAFIK